jgi:hypothetical protein
MVGQSGHLLTSGPAVALWSLGAYCLASGATRWANNALPGEPDPGLLGLSTGVQLVVMLVGGAWGLLGLALAGLLTAQASWPGTSLATQLGFVITQLAAPGLVPLALRRALRVAPDLSQLGFGQLITLLLAALMAHSAATSAYTVLAHGLPLAHWLPLASARLMGDFLGTSAVLALLVLLVALVQRRRLRQRGR